MELQCKYNDLIVQYTNMNASCNGYRDKQPCLLMH